MRVRLMSSICCGLSMAIVTHGGAQPIRVSVGETGTELTTPSSAASADAEGRLVVFTTENAPADFYLRDVQAGATTPVLLGPNGTRANAPVSPLISGDGQVIVFTTAATNLTAGTPPSCPAGITPNLCRGIYALDRRTGLVTLVSRTQDGGAATDRSDYASVSHDGRYIAFESYASNLVPGDTNARPDVFVFDRSTTQVRRVSVTSAGTEAAFDGKWDLTAGPSSISANGRYVTFASGANNLAPGDTEQNCVVDLVGLVNCADLFVHDLQTGVTERVSVNSAGEPADRGARYGVTSDDGRYVAFVSQASNLGAGPIPNRFSDRTRGGVFVRDRVRGTTTPVWGAGVSTDDLRTYSLSISRDGRLVGLTSFAALLPSAPLNAAYVWERGSGLRPIATPTGTHVSAFFGVTTTDGRAFVLTTGDGLLPADTNGVSDVYVLSAVDADGDALPDAWETSFGLNPYGTAGNDGAQGDPDGDGRTNAQEFVSHTHPGGSASATRYFAEGATSAFFETRISLANPGAQPARVLLRFDRTDGGPARSVAVHVPAGQSRKLTVSTVDEMAQAEFATVLESDQPVVAERLMWWSAQDAYGTHSERALTAPASTWYFAEGATTGNFNLFYLLQNPGDAPSEVRVRYLRAEGPPLDKLYTLPARSRTNIWANVEDINGQRLLAGAEFSAEVTVVSGPPIIAERAMYLDGGSGTRLFNAGHEAAGVTGTATEWFFAEGATGTYFDTFILLANASAADAEVQAEYLLANGTTVTRRYVVRASSRYTIWVDEDDPRIANVAASVRLRSLNGTPFVAERAMWWPGPTPSTWQEAHASTGSTVATTRWTIADGIVQDIPGRTDTYVLVANVTAEPARVRVSLLFDDGSVAQSKDFDVAAASRFTVDVRTEFPQAVGRGFGAVVESLNGQAIVVERSMYNDANGVHWAAGTNSLATPLP